MDKLGLLEMFIKVVENGSFAAAASHLGTSPSTISKAISRLEAHVQFKLFQRSTRQLKLTNAGVAYLETARHVLNTLDVSEQQLSTDKHLAKGTLRINLPVSYGRLYILPLVHEFQRRYPEIGFELSFNDEYVDMIEHGIDISIRTGRLNDSRFIAKQLSPIDFVTCASADYIAAHGVPTCASELAQHNWIRFRYKQSGRLMPIILRDQAIDPYFASDKQIIVDDGEALAELCAQGLGMTQLPHFIARNWLNHGRIQNLYPLYQPKPFGVFAIYAKSEYPPVKIRLFVDFLTQALASMGESRFSTWAAQLPTPYDLTVDLPAATNDAAPTQQASDITTRSKQFPAKANVKPVSASPAWVESGLD